MIMTQSKDVVILWDRDRLQNLKSFYAKNNPFKDCCFTADGSKICTLFRDSSIYFWNVSDFQITDLPKELQLETIDCSAKHLACGGKTPYLVIFDIETYFVERHLFRKIYKLPAGFERGITKLQFLRPNHTSTGEVSRLAILTTGVLIVVEVPSEEQAVEESKICDSKSENKPLRIAYSIKLPNMSIQDFDIDRNNNFVSLLTSEGNV